MASTAFEAAGQPTSPGVRDAMGIPDDASDFDNLDSGLPPVDVKGIADTATLIMKLSKGAIASDVYNIKRNAQNRAGIVQAQMVVQGLNLLGSVAGATINTFSTSKNAYQTAALSDPSLSTDVSSWQMMSWFFNQ